MVLPPAPRLRRDLDPSFGTAGRVVFEQSAGAERWDHVQPLANGDVLVASYTDKCIVRLNKDGAPVTLFGTAGQVTLSGAVGDMVAMPDGKILVALYEGGVIRLQSNGTMDSTWPRIFSR